MKRLHMAIVAAFVALLIAAPPAVVVLRAAAAIRVQNTGASTAANVSIVLAGVQAGDDITACFYERDGTAITGVSDDSNGPGTAYTQVFSRATAAARIGMYYFPDSVAGTLTITAAIAGTAPKDGNAVAWTGLGAAVTVDQTNNTSNASTQDHLHGSITPSAPALVISCLGLSNDHGGMLPHSGFTALDTDPGVTNAGRRYFAWKPTHTGAINVLHQSTNSQVSEGGVASFVEAAAATTCTGLMMLGMSRC